MSQRKFNTNAEQMRAEAVTLANSNAPVGTPTEVILAEAQKYAYYIEHDIPEDSDLAKVVDRVLKIKQLRQEKELREMEAKAEREATAPSVAEVDEQSYSPSDIVVGSWWKDASDDMVEVTELSNNGTVVEYIYTIGNARGNSGSATVNEFLNRFVGGREIEKDDTKEDPDVDVPEETPGQVVASSPADRAQEGSV